MQPLPAEANEACYVKLWKNEIVNGPSSGLGGQLMEHKHLVLLANSCNLHRNAVIFGSKTRCG